VVKTVGPQLKPVVGIDIDGTLAEYHSWFLRFAEMYLGRELPPYEEMDQDSLWRHAHIAKSTYRQIKLAYRQGGMKRSMPAYPNAAGLTRALRKAGAEIYIATTRPYLRLDNIDPDTRHWLRRNRIQFDGVLFGENKYRRLARLVGSERVVAVLDDLPELCGQAFSVGVQPILINRPHNAGIRADCEHVDNLFEAEELLTKLIGEWRALSDR
jgi:FMN phosphatase YigB (HAD superfamily)